MKQFKAPNLPKWSDTYNKVTIFLAGTIDMGNSENWQERVVLGLKDEEVVIFNPRRDDWDSSWKQEIGNKQFKEQVDWELNQIEKADIVVFYFAPGSMSPITLLELGLVCGDDPAKIILCCPDGYWRKGNVDIIAERYTLQCADSLEDLIEVIREEITAYEEGS